MGKIWAFHIFCYRHFPKFSDRQVWANSADPYQTAPWGAVWSGSTLFAKTVCNSLCIFWMHYSKEKPSCSTYRVITANFRMSEALGFLQYPVDFLLFPGWSESSQGAQSFCWFCHVTAHMPFQNMFSSGYVELWIVQILNMMPKKFSLFAQIHNAEILHLILINILKVLFIFVQH